MTWIFSEDFEGSNQSMGLKLNKPYALSVRGDQVSVFDVLESGEKTNMVFTCTRQEQAQSAYDKIKAMLKEGK
jgi:hypothetical protein